jgi:hypothetical protein
MKEMKIIKGIGIISKIPSIRDWRERKRDFITVYHPDRYLTFKEFATDNWDIYGFDYDLNNQVIWPLKGKTTQELVDELKKDEIDTKVMSMSYEDMFGDYYRLFHLPVPQRASLYKISITAREKALEKQFIQIDENGEKIGDFPVDNFTDMSWQTADKLNVGETALIGALRIKRVAKSLQTGYARFAKNIKADVLTYKELENYANMNQFKVYFKEGKIDDIRTDSLFYAKEFSDDLTGHHHNILVEDFGKDEKGFWAIFKAQGKIDTQGRTATLEDIIRIIEYDFDFIVNSIEKSFGKENQAFLKQADFEDEPFTKDDQIWIDSQKEMDDRWGKEVWEKGFGIESKRSKNKFLNDFELLDLVDENLKFDKDYYTKKMYEQVPEWHEASLKKNADKDPKEKLVGKEFRDKDTGTILIYKFEHRHPKTDKLINIIFEDKDGVEMALQSWSEVEMLEPVAASLKKKSEEEYTQDDIDNSIDNIMLTVKKNKIKKLTADELHSLINDNLQLPNAELYSEVQVQIVPRLKHMGITIEASLNDEEIEEDDILIDENGWEYKVLSMGSLGISLEPISLEAIREETDLTWEEFEKKNFKKKASLNIEAKSKEKLQEKIKALEKKLELPENQKPNKLDAIEKEINRLQLQLNKLSSLSKQAIKVTDELSLYEFIDDLLQTGMEPKGILRELLRDYEKQTRILLGKTDEEILKAIQLEKEALEKYEKEEEERNEKRNKASLKQSWLKKAADGDDILESVDYGYTISDLTDKDLLETIKNEEEGLAGILEHDPNATEKVMEPLVLLYEERDRRGLGKKKSWLNKKADVEKDKAWEEYKKLRTEIKINQQFGDRSLNKELWNKVEKMEEKNPDFDQKYYWEIETENN